jgi:hypothetical protein
MTDVETELEAAAFRHLLAHLRMREDVQNIDLMISAGFCRNCLADWYREAAVARGIELEKDAARERIYGEPFAQWKAKHQLDATPAQLAAFEAAQERQRESQARAQRDGSSKT